MYIFFDNRIVNKTSEWALYCSFYVLTGLVYLLFHFPPATIGINIVIIYIITQIYEGDQRKKVLVTVLVYGINMICDILAIFSLSDYIVGKEYNEVAVYITVFLISICEFIAEKFAMKNKKTEFAPPYWNILFFIPVISIIVLLVLIMCNLKNRIALVTVSAGILFINMLIFFFVSYFSKYLYKIRRKRNV